MKTLDEVIKAQERCGTYPNCHFCFLHSGPMCEWIRDALQWLKGYKAHIELDKLRDKYSDTSQITCPKCHSEFVILPDINTPLTWQELRTMAGKPVWIEGEHGCIWDQKAWSLIRLDAENEDIVICVSTDNGVHYEFAIGEEDYGSDWQAYRKERP